MLAVVFTQVRDNSDWDDSWVMGMAKCAQLRREVYES